MSFLVRPVRHEDVNQLVDLAKQFGLLNLPGDKKVIARKIEKSVASFSREVESHQAEYLFVLEDLEVYYLFFSFGYLHLISPRLITNQIIRLWNSRLSNRVNAF